MIRRNLIAHSIINTVQSTHSSFEHQGSPVENQFQLEDDQLLGSDDDNLEEDDVIELGDRDTDQEDDNEVVDRRYRSYSRNRYHQDEEGYGISSGELLVYRSEDDEDYVPMEDGDTTNVVDLNSPEQNNGNVIELDTSDSDNEE